MNQIPEAPGKDELCWLPLGGTGEIGMNLNLYGHAGQWLMIDLGITFPEDSSLPGIEVLMPDPTFIEERRDRLAGLVLTHGHEDHIGAVAYLWPRLGCPVYATPFTANLLRAKLQEAGLLRKVELLEVPLSGRFKVGPFDLELITLTHSIPEPNAVVIRTPLGTVLHTGDWKLDPDPVVGDDYDDQRLRALAGEGVMALIGDSTNAMVEGSSGSEAEVRRALTELIAGKKNRVIVTCFATNVARLAGIFHAAKAAGRRVCLVGRSMRRIFEAATETGYLKNLPPLVEEEDVGFLPRGEVLILATGSQGEARAAMMKLAGDLNKHIVLERGDTVIFSSRVIPGNERAIFRLQDALVKKGLDVITDANHFVHVSGHPAREELTQMYQWVRPQIAVPTHGTPRHIAAHAELARRCQVPQALETANGDWVQLTPKGAKVIRQVPTGRLALDGTRLVSVESTAVKARSKMGFAGSAVATVVINRKGHLAAAPQVSAQGLVEDPSDLELAVGEIEDALGKISGKDRHDDDKIRDALRIALRRAFFRLTGKKPVAEIHLIRL